MCFKFFPSGLIPSMDRAQMQRVYRLLKEAREQGHIPWAWIVDETRELERVSTWSNPAAYARCVARSYRRDFWFAAAGPRRGVERKGHRARRARPGARRVCRRLSCDARLQRSDHALRRFAGRQRQRIDRALCRRLRPVWNVDVRARPARAALQVWRRSRITEADRHHTSEYAGAAVVPGSGQEKGHALRLVRQEFW